MPDQRQAFWLLRRLLAGFTLSLLVLAGVPSTAQQSPLPLPGSGSGSGDGGGGEQQASGENGEQGNAGSEASFDPALADPDIALERLTLQLVPMTAPELAALAEAWQGIVRRQTEAIAEQQVTLLGMEGEAEAQPREALDRLYDARARSFDAFGAVVEALQSKGGDAAAVASFRAYRTGILLAEAQAADWQTLLQMAVRWVTDPDGGLGWAVTVGILLVSLIALLTVARIVRRGVRRAVEGLPDLSDLMQAFLAMTAYWLVVAIGLMVVLAAVGINITPLFALIGGASFIIAFALQDTLGNLASGLMIMFNRPFDEGDYVMVAGTAGTVKSVSVSSTELATPDNQLVTVPNSKVWGDVITNVTANKRRRLELVFGISYADPLGTAQEVLERVVTEHPMVLSDPEPVVRVNELGDSAVNLIVWIWVKTPDYFTVKWDVTRQGKEALEAAGLSIPFPQRDMHVILPSDGLPLRQLPAQQSDGGQGRPEGAPDYHSGASGEEEGEGGSERG